MNYSIFVLLLTLTRIHGENTSLEKRVILLEKEFQNLRMEIQSMKVESKSSMCSKFINHRNDFLNQGSMFGTLIPPPNEVWGKVMLFTCLSFCPRGEGVSVWCHFLSGCLVSCSFPRGSLSPVPCSFQGVSVKGGLCLGGLCPRGHSWGLLPGGLCLAILSLGGLILGSLCSGSLSGRAPPPPPIRWRADGTHPIGMHTYFKEYLSSLVNWIHLLTDTMFSFSTRLHEDTTTSDSPVVFGTVDLNIGDGYDEFTGNPGISR